MNNSKVRSFASPAASPSFLAALEKLLGGGGPVARLVRTGALAGAIALSLGPAATGCIAPAGDETEEVSEAEEAVIGGGQSDWAQGEGQRNPTMVSYYGERWWSFTDCGSRFGCQGIDLFIKLRVKPVAGASLDWKKVGVVYRTPGSNDLVTALGSYFTTWGNGDEEWHVKVHLRSAQNLVSFNAWYQDGAGHTYFDDNSGELHAIAIGSSAAAITHLWQNTNVAITPQGVEGTVSVRLADIDFDKQVAMVWTTDDWQTVGWMNMGSGANQWRWVEDYGSDYERWDVDVSLPGNFSKFQYAIVYRHGVVNGAALYEFWDNNGGSNWVVVPQ